MIGESIAHYRITGLLGEGGMGQVYRAMDTRLQREIAVKILPEAFASDPQRIARFQREARLLASLSHPSIGTIHGVEQHGSTIALILELIEGPTLAERLSNGPLEADDCIRIALQVAEALKAAHENGVVHRDLKPANIKVSEQGEVKVLDFGLARAEERDGEVRPELSQSPTLSLAGTQVGMVLGTAAYMSPEQAKGRTADRRADIWAFGAVLFEMFAGRQAFQGDDLSEVLASVLKCDVDWDHLPAATPRPVVRLLKRCLEPDVLRRYQDIGDVRFDLEQCRTAPDTVEVRTDLPSWFSRSAMSIMLLATILLTAAATWFLKPDVPTTRTPVVRNRILLPDSATSSRPVLSPDGRMLAYQTGDEIWIRHFDQFEPQPVPQTQGAGWPFFSPDSRFIGFLKADRLWKLNLGNDTLAPICEVESGFAGATWGNNGTIVFGRFGAGLSQVAAQGGDPEEILQPNRDGGESGLVFPSFLPDSRGVIFSTWGPGSDELGLLAGGQRRTLMSQEDAEFFRPVYSPTGHLIYRRTRLNPGLFAVPFSLSTFRLEGTPFLIDAAADWASVSDDLTLSFTNAGVTGQRQMVEVDREGTVLQTLGPAATRIRSPRVSPDGEWVACILEEDSKNDVWIFDRLRENRRKVSYSGAARSVVWHPSGREVAFDQSGEIWIRPIDGTAEPRKLVDGFLPEFSPDGRFLVFSRLGPEDGMAPEIWLKDLQEDSERPFFLTAAAETAERGSPLRAWSGTVSPDGKWFAYQTSDSGERAVYVKEFPSGAGLWQISSGHSPRWSENGKELYFMSSRSLMRVPVSVEPTFDFGVPSAVPGPSGQPLFLGWDVVGNGESFIILRLVEVEEASPSISIVQNWFADFR